MDYDFSADLVKNSRRPKSLSGDKQKSLPPQRAEKDAIFAEALQHDYYDFIEHLTNKLFKPMTDIGPTKRSKK